MTEQPKEYIITEDQLNEHRKLAYDVGCEGAHFERHYEQIAEDALSRLENEIRSRPVSTTPERAAPEPHTEQCKSCIFDGRRECTQHGYPEDCIPPSCDFKIGKLAVIAPIEAQLHNREHDAAIAQTTREEVLNEIKTWMRKHCYWFTPSRSLDEQRYHFDPVAFGEFLLSLRQYKEQP